MGNRGGTLTAAEGGGLRPHPIPPLYFQGGLPPPPDSPSLDVRGARVIDESRIDQENK